MPRIKLNLEEEDTVALTILLPTTTRETIKKRAIKNYRSMSQEAVFLIELALDYLAKELDQAVQ